MIDMDHRESGFLGRTQTIPRSATRSRTARTRTPCATIRLPTHGLGHHGTPAVESAPCPRGLPLATAVLGSPRPSTVIGNG